ncbi:uncharacterized protein LOC122831395, partial [Scomber scombrus]
GQGPNSEKDATKCRLFDSVLHLGDCWTTLVLLMFLMFYYIPGFLFLTFFIFGNEVKYINTSDVAIMIKRYCECKICDVRTAIIFVRLTCFNGKAVTPLCPTLHALQDTEYEAGEEAVAVGEEMLAKSSVIRFDYLNQRGFIYKTASKRKHTAVCKFCNATLIETAGTTSNFYRHLERKRKER